VRVVALIPSTFNALLDVEAGDLARRRSRSAAATLAIADDVASLRASVRDAEILVLAPRYGDWLREVWPDAQHLRWIHSLGAGVEKLPFDLLRETDVVVTNSRGIYSDSLAEWVIGAMLFFAKDLRRLLTMKRWEPVAVQRLEGATLGIIGFGSIGSAIADRATAFGMRIVTARRGEPVDELIASSDYIVLSTPLTEATHRLMNEERIARMKPTAVLINISRGSVVDEAALIDALRHHRIRGAALDVFEVEPLPPESPLWSLDNVLLSPHSADHTRDSHERAVALFHRNFGKFQRGEPLENIVDKQAGY